MFMSVFFRFFSPATATTTLYTLSLHDALPIYTHDNAQEAAIWTREHHFNSLVIVTGRYHMPRTMREFSATLPDKSLIDRKSTRLNSSHRCISYAVFCLKKKNQDATPQLLTYSS